MRILITGATGSMAYYLARHIKMLRGHEIYGIGRKYNPHLEFVDRYDQVDIYWQPTSRLIEYIGYAKPEIVFHLAAMANVRESFSDPRKFGSNNTEGTQNLFEAIARSGLKPRVVLASTSEVYGNVPQMLNPIQECQPFKPVNPYAVTKCNQESYASYYSAAFGIPFVITRAFGYINPRREDLVATALATQLVDCERGKKSAVYHGDLSPVRSFCDVRDIAEAYWLATTCPPGVYNIGSSTPCSIKGLADILRSTSTAKTEWCEQELLRRPTDIFYAVPDVYKFRRATLWKPRVSLHESLAWLMEEARKR